MACPATETTDARDDRHVREIHRHVVDEHRVAVLQPDAAAARHPRADPAVSGVKEHGQPRFREDFVERIRDAVVGRKLLEGRMKFEAANAARLHQLARLAHAVGAARGIDAREGDRDVRMPPRIRPPVRWGTRRPVSSST